ncbi:MAG: SIS domain-containing protein [Elusimicrobiota bacterium]|jgi:D-sedoheptulose 7-phosphate isomerase
MPKNLETVIRSQLVDAGRSLAATARLAPKIAQAARILLAAYQRGNKALIFGNGGSASDAQHFAAELVGRFDRNRPPLPALALTVNASNLTAIANDFGLDQMFSRQLEAQARPGDVAVAISTSGNSKNVLHAAAKARSLGLPVIGLTGGKGGKLASAADICLRVPSAHTARIQESHIAIIHLLCGLIEDGLFPNSPKAH